MCFPNIIDVYDIISFAKRRFARRSCLRSNTL
ncbi:uncharacterized protein METZ01_LOCUS344567, partial [marine metagenome]